MGRRRKKQTGWQEIVANGEGAISGSGVGKRNRRHRAARRISANGNNAWRENEAARRKAALGMAATALVVAAMKRRKWQCKPENRRRQCAVGAALSKINRRHQQIRRQAAKLMAKRQSKTNGVENRSGENNPKKAMAKVSKMKSKKK